MLIDSAPSVPITIARGSQAPSPSTIATVCDSVRHAAYLGSYCAAKLPLGMKTLPLMIPKDPLRQSMGGVLVTNNYAPFPIELNAVAMVDIL